MPWAEVREVVQTVGLVIAGMAGVVQILHYRDERRHLWITDVSIYFRRPADGSVKREVSARIFNLGARVVVGPTLLRLRRTWVPPTLRRAWYRTSRRRRPSGTDLFRAYLSDAPSRWLDHGEVMDIRADLEPPMGLVMTLVRTDEEASHLARLLANGTLEISCGLGHQHRAPIARASMREIEQWIRDAFVGDPDRAGPDRSRLGI